MKREKFLDVDDKGKKYRTHAEVLNDLVNKKTKDDKPYKLALDSVWDITDKKRIWFPHIATSDDGAWETPPHIKWINIPSPDRCTITQIPLEKCKTKDKPEGIEYAVFNCEKPDKSDEPSAYRFYGIFKQVKTNEQNITIWKRISATLEIKEWQATV